MARPAGGTDDVGLLRALVGAGEIVHARCSSSRGRMMVNLPWGPRIPPVSGFRLLVVSAVLGAVVAVGAIAFLAACEVVTRLALTQGAGYQPGGPAGENVLGPSAVGGSPRVWLLVPIAVLGGLVTGWVTRRLAPEAAGPGTDTAIRAYYDSGGGAHGRV